MCVGHSRCKKKLLRTASTSACLALCDQRFSGKKKIRKNVFKARACWWNHLLARTTVFRIFPHARRLPSSHHSRQASSHSPAHRPPRSIPATASTPAAGGAALLLPLGIGAPNPDPVSQCPRASTDLFLLPMQEADEAGEELERRREDNCCGCHGVFSAADATTADGTLSLLAPCANTTSSSENENARAPSAAAVLAITP